MWAVLAYNSSPHKPNRRIYRNTRLSASVDNTILVSHFSYNKQISEQSPRPSLQSLLISGTQWNSVSFKKIAHFLRLKCIDFGCFGFFGAYFIYCLLFPFRFCCFFVVHEGLKMLLISRANNGKYVCII